ncbi:hypothetical protein, partial [Enterococcus faecium]|uniref:hypothetical protein n=1 Tax=Enterococcus faecium TaxID=1352 RepID=UPI002E778EB5
FQGVFSIFFYTKKMLVKFTNIKKYRAKIKRSCDMFFVTASFSENSFLFLGVAHFFCNLILSFLADG